LRNFSFRKINLFCMLKIYFWNSHSIIPRLFIRECKKSYSTFIRWFYATLSYLGKEDWRLKGFQNEWELLTKKAELFVFVCLSKVWKTKTNFCCFKTNIVFTTLLNDQLLYHSLGWHSREGSVMTVCLAIWTVFLTVER